MHAGEAHLELLRVRQTKVGLINGAVRRLGRDEDVQLLEQGERASLAFAQIAKVIAALDRYERRALARRNRALRKLRKLERIARRGLLAPGTAASQTRAQLSEPV